MNESMNTYQEAQFNHNVIVCVFKWYFVSGIKLARCHGYK